MLNGRTSKRVLMVFVVAVGLSPAANAAAPPASGDGAASGVGQMDARLGPGLIAFEAVREDGVVTGVVSRVLVPGDGTGPVYERLGHVTCLHVVDGRATLHFVVDQTNQDIAVGRVLQVHAIDGGLLSGDRVATPVLDHGRQPDPTNCPRPPRTFWGQPVDGDVTITSTD